MTLLGGSPFAAPCQVRYLFHSRTQGKAQAIQTALSNTFTRLQLTDMETGYKAFRSKVLQGLTLRSKRFGFEPEITAKIARGGAHLREVPIADSPRPYAEDKKMRGQDGFVALWTILRCTLLEAHADDP